MLKRKINRELETINNIISKIILLSSVEEMVKTAKILNKKFDMIEFLPNMIVISGNIFEATIDLNDCSFHWENYCNIPGFSYLEYKYFIRKSKNDQLFELIPFYSPLTFVGELYQ